MLLLTVPLLLTVYVVVTPSDAHSTGVVGARKFATADDCAGSVVFSSVGATLIDKKLAFTSGLVDKSIGWSRENGDFTCHCPGIYQFSFTASGDQDARISLKKKLLKNDAWTTVVSTSPGGGASIILLEMDIGDQAAIFLDSGKLHPETAILPVATFSGFRIAKK